MEKASPKPSIIPALLALLVFIIVSYFLFTNLEVTRTEHDIGPAIEIIDDNAPPLTVIKPSTEAPSSEQITEQEAEVFVNNLATTNEFITINENEDKFVRHDSVIVLPNLEYLATTKQGLLEDTNLNPDTPITLNYITNDKKQTTLEELANTIEDQTEIITIITADGTERSAPLAELIAQHKLALNEPITHVIPHKHRIDTTMGELKNIVLAEDQPLMATITHGSQAVTLKDLTQSETLPDDALFYLHRVTSHDVQGLWGIIQTGLIDKFRRGLKIEGITPNKELIQAVIPPDADEKLPSGLSSFLGKILDNKVDNSFVYNLKTRSMGHDANLIYPGQQLILIHFSANELKQIYQYFSEQRNQDIETFAITN